MTVDGLRYAGERPSCSVVIPTWAGSTGHLEPCLRAVRGQMGPAPEVILVLDGPCPEIEALARRVLPAVRMVRLKENRGFAAAAGAGLRAARGALILLLNDDAEPEPDWIEQITDAAARTPDAGSFASLVVDAADTERIDSAGHGLCSWGEAFEIGHGCTVGEPFLTERWVFGAPGSAAVYRRELLLETRGLAEGFTAFLEDVDLSLRAQLLGFPCLYVPRARVRHRRSASYGWGRGYGRAEALILRNRGLLLARGFPVALLRAQAPGIAASWMAATLHGAIRGRSTRPVSDLVAGLRAARGAWVDRPGTLGPRRADDRAIRTLLAESERHLAETLQAGPAPTLRRVWMGALRAIAGNGPAGNRSA